MNKNNQMYIKLAKKVLFISSASASSLFLAFLTLGISSVASAQSTNEPCSLTYNPGSYQQRVSSGLFDGKVGQAKFINETANPVTIRLYHPDSPQQQFSQQVIPPNNTALLGDASYGSDWGIQINNSPICVIGFVVNTNTSQNFNGFTISTESFYRTSSEILNRRLTATKNDQDLINIYSQLISVQDISLYAQKSKRYSYFKRGNTYYNLGEYQKAINDYTQVIQLTPSTYRFYHTEAYYNLGNIYYKLGKPQLAIDNYTLSIKSQYYHQFPEAYYNRSIVRAQIGDEQGASEDLNSLMDLYLNPSNDVSSTVEKCESNSNSPSDCKFITELNLSNLDGNIMPILQEIRWQSSGYPLIPRKDAWFNAANTIDPF